MRSFSGQLLDEARELFIEGKYKDVEPLLNQPTLQNSQNPEVFQMLATIYYNQGQFNKAIKTFKKALSVDPSYSDAAVGLSIILNDLGKYDEAKKIFEDAQKIIDQRKQKNINLANQNIDEKFAQKHRELGDMYLSYKRYENALEQFRTAYKMSNNKQEALLQIAETLVQMGKSQFAVQELKSHLQRDPNSVQTRLKLGLVLYNSHMIAEAVEQWETVLRIEARNDQAVRYLKMAQTAGITDLKF